MSTQKQPDGHFCLTVPLPPPSLRSNSRAHWARKMRDKKAYSEQVWAACQGGGPFVTLEKAHVLYVWKHAGIAPDVGNIGPNTKALQDFLCCAPDNGLQRNDCYYLGLIRDDRGITPTYAVQRVPHRRDEGVEITITRDEHEYCAQDFHRCDGGGKGEYDRYVTPERARE